MMTTIKTLITFLLLTISCSITRAQTLYPNTTFRSKDTVWIKNINEEADMRARLVKSVEYSHTLEYEYTQLYQDFEKLNGKYTETLLYYHELRDSFTSATNDFEDINNKNKNQLKKVNRKLKIQQSMVVALSAVGGVLLVAIILR